MPASNSRIPRWSADGKHLYFAFVNKLFEADVTGGVPSEPRLVFEEPNTTFGTFWPSADDQRFLIQLISPSETSSPVEVITGWTPPKS